MLFDQLQDAAFSIQISYSFITIKLIRTRNRISFLIFLFVRVLIINQGSMETKYCICVISINSV